MADRITQLQRMLTADPRDAFCLYGLAQEYAKRGDQTTAVDYFDRAIEADPDSCYAYYHKAKCLAIVGRLSDARAAVELGLARAQAIGDMKAAGELAAYREELV